MIKNTDIEFDKESGQVKKTKQVTEMEVVQKSMLQFGLDKLEK